jgi:serine-type D-Ala-D-Ala carboxypeptidase (penicillin-binding protein 5/6)
VVSAVAAPAEAAGPEAVGCARCIIVDEDGEVLWARNPRDRYPNASTTKMVTALLVSQGADPSEVVTVSGAAGAIGGGGLDLQAGETYTVDALMYALLLDSSNEAAHALAEHVGGTVERFVAAMNRYLDSIGATRSHFANPHGLDAEGHYSSAGDLALVGAEVLADPYLAEIVATPEATIDTPGGSASFENRNELLEGYAGAIGIKTGRTLGAGYVLVAAAERNDHRVITVAMNSYDVFGDSAAMLDWGFAKLRRLDRRGNLIEPGASVGELVFDPGSAEVIAGAALEGVVPRDPADIELSFVASPDTELPLEDGDVVGEIEVTTPRGEVGSVPAVASGSVPAVDEGPWWTGPVRGLVGLVGGVLS